MDKYEIECRELFKKLPEEQQRKVFKAEYNQLDNSFLGFIQQYKNLAEIIPNDWIILDFGCNEAAQCFYFEKHKAYYGIDPFLSLPGTEHFSCENSLFFAETAQEFIKKRMKDFKNKKVFAICNYVPDFEATKLVRETFPNCFIFYP